MLKRVSIQNFKSLKDVTLDLQKVNLLIGPNNSGKTNFLKALEFFSKQLKGYIEDNMSDYSFKYSKEPSITIRLIRDCDDIFDQKIKFEIFSLKFESNYPQKRKVLRTWTTEHFNEIKEEKGTVYNLYSQDFWNLVEKEGTQYKFFKNIEIALGDYIIYKPTPDRMIMPLPLVSTLSLEPDCSNAINFLHTLSTTDKNEYKLLEKDFAYCVGDLVEISVPPVNTPQGGKLGLKFFDKDGIGYWGQDVSEGVLYFLALLCIIHQPNPPKLLLLEEPEKGIHPRRIWEVMKFIFQLAEEKNVQIILTSHNEHVVNAFSSMPEAVFVFDKDEEGATEVRNLQKDIIEPSHKRSAELGLEGVNFTDNLGENWIYGLLGGVPTDND